MMDAQWLRIAPCAAIPPREGRVVHVADREIAIFNLGGRFLAVDNRCPHRGGPLADGIVSGSSVVCPLHAWKIDLETGQVARPAGPDAPCVATYPVRVEAGILLMQVPVDVQAGTTVSDGAAA